MTKRRLFPEPPKESEDDTRPSRERFSDLSTKVFSVPKSEIDKREKEWQRMKGKSR
jgi:hypothetical protein